MENQKYYQKLKEIMDSEERKNKMISAVLCSNGTEISLEQKSQEWLQWRKEGVTATEAVIIIRGEHFGKTIDDLFNEKIGKELPKNISNKYIQRGVVFEESVLQFVSTHRQVSVKKATCYENQILPFLRCSLDGECVMNGKNMDLEVKCLSKKTFEELMQHGISSETYRKYWTQIQYQLMVTGYQNAVLACVEVDDTKMYRYQEFIIARDDEFIKSMLEKTILFWLKVVSYQAPQEPHEPKIPTLNFENKDLKDLIDQRSILENKVKEIQKEIDQRFAVIQKEMNEKQISKVHLGFGIYAKNEAKGSFDYKAFLAAKGVMITLEDEENYRKKSSVRWSFKPVQD